MKRALSLSLVYALLMLTVRIAGAQSATGDPLSLSEETTPGAAAKPVPFTPFEAFAAGPITTSNNLLNCPDVHCASGSCSSCGTFTGLNLTGLSGATLSGELVSEVGLGVGFTAGSCLQLHGISTATAKQFTITFGV